MGRLTGGPLARENHQLCLGCQALVGEVLLYEATTSANQALEYGARGLGRFPVRVVSDLAHPVDPPLLFRGQELHAGDEPRQEPQRHAMDHVSKPEELAEYKLQPEEYVTRIKVRQTKIWLVEKVEAGAKGVSGDDIVGACPEDRVHHHWLAVAMLANSPEKRAQPLVYNGLEAADTVVGEEGTDGVAPTAVVIVIDGGDERVKCWLFQGSQSVNIKDY